MFIVNGATKIAEEDNYQEGCLPDTSYMVDIDLSFRGATIEELIEQLKIYYGEEYLVNPCEDDPSRIDFQRMEDSEGCEASKNQIEAWKKGRFKLWVVTYTMNIEKSETVNLDDYNL